MTGFVLDRLRRKKSTGLRLVHVETILSTLNHWDFFSLDAACTGQNAHQSAYGHYNMQAEGVNSKNLTIEKKEEAEGYEVAPWTGDSNPLGRRRDGNKLERGGRHVST